MSEPLSDRNERPMFNFRQSTEKPQPGDLDFAMPCPHDTNGDGDCGRRLCPFCGVSPSAAAQDAMNPPEHPWGVLWRIDNERTS